MFNRMFTAPLAALVLMLAAQPGIAADGDKAGKVLRLKNNAMAMQDATPRPLKVGSDILVGDVISTGKDARIEFTMLDGSTMTLGERTVFVVTEFLQAPGQENMTLRLLSGAFKASSGQIAAANPEAMQVATDFGTIGIRGTTVWGGTLEKVFEVALLDGKAVRVTTRSGRVDLTKVGDGTAVESQDRAPTAPVSWGREKLSRAAATVDFGPQPAAAAHAFGTNDDQRRLDISHRRPLRTRAHGRPGQNRQAAWHGAAPGDNRPRPGKDPHSGPRCRLAAGRGPGTRPVHGREVEPDRSQCRGRRGGLPGRRP